MKTTLLFFILLFPSLSAFAGFASWVHTPDDAAYIAPVDRANNLFEALEKIKTYESNPFLQYMETQKILKETFGGQRVVTLPYHTEPFRFTEESLNRGEDFDEIESLVRHIPIEKLETLPKAVLTPVLSLLKMETLDNLRSNLDGSSEQWQASVNAAALIKSSLIVRNSELRIDESGKIQYRVILAASALGLGATYFFGAHMEEFQKLFDNPEHGFLVSAGVLMSMIATAVLAKVDLEKNRNDEHDLQERARSTMNDILNEIPAWQEIGKSPCAMAFWS